LFAVCRLVREVWWNIVSWRPKSVSARSASSATSTSREVQLYQTVHFSTLCHSPGMGRLVMRHLHLVSFTPKLCSCMTPWTIWCFPVCGTQLSLWG
jgi:hypothetical protein